MEVWTSYVFPALTFLLLAFLYFTIRNLLPSYFNEKGKNLATKEDISEITNLVETVRHAFVTEAEKLKANLSLLTNVHGGIAAEERNAIVDFIECYSKWKAFLTDASMGHIDQTSNSELETYKRAIAQSYIDVNASEARLALFVDDDELLTYIGKTIFKTLEELGHLQHTRIRELTFANNDMVRLMKEPANKDRSEKHAKILAEKSRINTEYREKCLAGHREISPMNSQLRTRCREHIYRLLKREE